MRNSAKILSANVLAQVFALGVYPFISRIYTPADFGLFQLFMSIGGVLTIVATADYFNAIVLPKEQEKGVACFHVGFICLLITTAICVLSVCFKQELSLLFKTPELTSVYPLMPIYVFIIPCWYLVSYWYTREKKFSEIARYQVGQSALNSLSKYGFGIEAVGGGLVIATVFAPVVALLISVFTHFKKTLRPLFVFNKELCRETAIEYRNFPKYSLPKTLINYINSNLPILLLTPIFGISQIGFWGMALTLAFRPINMISGSLYQVFYQQTAERVNNKQSIGGFFKKFVNSTLLLILPTFAMLYFILPWLVKFLLGAGWESTATLIQFMLPWLVVCLINATINYLVDVFGKQKANMWIEVARSISTVSVLLIGSEVGNFHSTMLCFCASQFLFSAGQIIWYLSLVNTYEKRLKAQ